MPVRRLAVSVLAALPLGAADITLHGRVVDGTGAPVDAAHVTAQRAANAAYAAIAAQTDPGGAFTLTLPAAGVCLFDLERQGFYALRNRAAHIKGSEDHGSEDHDAQQQCRGRSTSIGERKRSGHG